MKAKPLPQAFSIRIANMVEDPKVKETADALQAVWNRATPDQRAALQSAGIALLHKWVGRATA